MAEMTATEASRGFSELMDRVADGETVLVTRGGRPVARIEPAGSATWISGQAFLALLASLPPLDEDFQSDLEEIRREANSRPARATPSEWD